MEFGTKYTLGKCQFPSFFSPLYYIDFFLLNMVFFDLFKEVKFQRALSTHMIITQSSNPPG